MGETLAARANSVLLIRSSSLTFLSAFLPIDYATHSELKSSNIAVNRHGLPA
jgi:hypothetical protein